jgi:predicted nuclease with TOPRIM domain
MNEELIRDLLERHDKRLDSHGNRLDCMERDNSALKAEIKNLCSNLKSLTDTLKAIIGLGGATLVGFFIWYVQKISYEVRS